VLSDYAKGALADASAHRAGARAARAGARRSQGHGTSSAIAARRRSTPNLGEFEAVVGHCADDATLVERGERAARRDSISSSCSSRAASAA
jgi:D-beta-D-heptose 7-phosphate kinase/D-beta-D-heptose 1-phosphate adenosyltransferase